MPIDKRAANLKPLPMTTVTLNENETLILKSLISEMDACTGGEFGYMSDANKLGFSKHEFAGYISSLQKKGVFQYIDTDSGEEYQGQFAVKQEIYDEYSK